MAHFELLETFVDESHLDRDLASGAAPSMKYDKTIRRGTVVYDVADPRHHGIVRSLDLRDGKFTASVKWIETGSCNRVPVADLRRVTDETQDPRRGR